MIEIGKNNKLRIIRQTAPGMFLGEDEVNVVLLPNKYIEKNFKIGDEIDVFIYKDSEDRLIATTLKPFVEVNQFAFLFVSQMSLFDSLYR